MTQKVKCVFSYPNWPFLDKIYTCYILDQTIDSKSILAFDGTHEDSKRNVDVIGVHFLDCQVSKVPQGLTKIFPNLRHLNIWNSKLNDITCDCLKEYANLESLCLNFNNISFIFADLFENFTNLKYLVINESEIELIEPGVFDKLRNLKILNLKHNICIDECFDNVGKRQHTATMEEIKKKIQENYSTWIANVESKVNDIIQSDSLGLKNKALEILQTKSETNKRTNNQLMVKIEEFEAIMENENLKDFTIKIKDEEFKAHKFVLAARCPAFKTVIEENIHAEVFNLVNVSTNIFKEIFDFIYTDKLPESDDIDFIELLKTSDRLKIEKLKDFAARKLLNLNIINVDVDHALEILIIGNKCGIAELKKKSFDEIKKFFDTEPISDELMNDPEKLRELIEIKKEKNEMLKQLEEKFNTVLNQN